MRDSFVVTREGIFEIFGPEEDDGWQAHPVKVKAFEPNIGFNLPWDLVGVYM